MQRWLAGHFLFAAISASACELTEVTLVESDDVVIVEALLQLHPGPTPGNGRALMRVFLHRTLRPDGSADAVPGAVVRVESGRRGWVFDIPEIEASECAVVTPELGTGTCHGLSIGPGVIAPGDVAELRIDFPADRSVRATSSIPGPFDLLRPEVDHCALPPKQNFEITWSVASGAQAYISETTISGLDAALEPLGIDVEHEPLRLTGLSVSSTDTVVVYPSQLGIFSRTEIERDLAAELREGLPQGAEAEVAIAAVDRNFVNWARGQSFNPTGLVRVPSVIGDGTGFFGSAVVRVFSLETGTAPSPELPPCAPPAREQLL